MRSQIIKFAIFVAVTGGIILFIGSQIVKTNFGGRYGLVATFDDITGLNRDDDVKLAGVVVGKVTSIDADKGRARVSFQVNDSVDLPEDSRASVRWRNLIGQRYLYVVPGSSPKMLEGGDRVRHTDAVVDFGRLVNNLGPVAQAIDPDELNEVLTALVQTVDGNEENLDQLFTNLGNVLATLGDRDETIGRLVGDYEKITTTIARRDEQIQTMVDNLVLLSQTFADNSELLDRSLVEMGGFTSNLDILLTRNADELTRIIQNLAIVVDAADDHIGSLEEALAALPEAARRLFSTVNSGEFIKTQLVCISLEPPPACLTPIVVPDDVEGSAGTQSAKVLQPGPGRLDSQDAWRRLLIGANS